MDPNAFTTSATASSRPLIRAPGLRTKLHVLLNRPSATASGQRLRAATLLLILLSTLCFVLQSLPALATWVGWVAFDALVAVIFTIELAAKLWVAPDGRGDEEYDSQRLSSPQPSTAFKARIRFLLEPMSLVDVLAVVPFWFGIFLPTDGSWVSQLFRALRLMRILRMLRLAQESSELLALVGCIRQALPALRMLSFFLILELIIIGGLAFHAERGNGPQAPGPDGLWHVSDGQPAEFQSIPDAMWWALVTISTVGYGDKVPTTLLGKLIACAAMLTGLVGISSIVSIIQTEMQFIRAERGGFLRHPQSARAGGTGGVIAADARNAAMSSSEEHDLERHIELLRAKLAERRRTCATGSSDAQLSLEALEGSALGALAAFSKISLQGTGLRVLAHEGSTGSAGADGGERSSGDSGMNGISGTATNASTAAITSSSTPPLLAGQVQGITSQPVVAASSSSM